MKPSVAKSIILLALIFLPFYASAQKASFEFYNSENGLSGNLTFDVTQDDQGLIWFMNEGKLTRFDGREFQTIFVDSPQKDAFARLGGTYQDSLLVVIYPKSVVLFHPRTNEKSAIWPIDSSVVHERFIDGTKIGPAEFLVHGFDERFPNEACFWRFRKNRFEKIPFPGEGLTVISSGHVMFDYNDQLYVFNRKKDLQKLAQDGSLLQEIPIGRKIINSHDLDSDFDVDNNLLVLIEGEFSLLKDGAKEFITHPINRFINASAGLEKFLWEANGDIWACGGDRYLVYYDYANDTLYNFKSDLEKIIPHSTELRGIFKDNMGVIWGESLLGLLKITPQANLFDQYFTGKQSICRNNFCSFRGFAEDKDGMIYTSYYDGIRKLDPNRKIEYPPLPIRQQPFDLEVEEDYLILNSGKRFDLRRNVLENVAGGITKEFTFDYGNLTKDQEGRLWWSNRNGIYKLDKSSDNWVWEEIIPFFIDQLVDSDALHAGKFSSRIWSSQIGELISYHTDSKIIDIFHMEDFGIPISRILAIEEIQQGFLWLATDNGLVFFHPEQGVIKHYTAEEGLANNFISGMLMEGDSSLWLSTNNGLSRFNIDKENFVNFFVEDGLSNNEFNRISYFKASDGRFFFGGLNGIIAFFPKDVMKAYQEKKSAAQLVLTSFERRDEKRDTLIKQVQFPNGEGIELGFWDRSYTFEFALTDYANPEAISYSYQMEGHELHWSTSSTVNYARYSSLPSGKYVFKVRARDKSGDWLPNQLAVKLIVHPPWWATWFAYLLYSIIVGGIVFLIYRFLKKRWQLQNQLVTEKGEAQRLKELDQFKSRLYTNITHEFRTPLTVILGMSQKIISEPTKEPEKAAHLIERNGENLLHLINQLLDLSKLEDNSFKLNYSLDDVVPYIRYLTESFQTFANSSNLGLRFFSNLESLEMDYDAEQLKQILTNLISNAIKFTDSGGEIKVKLSQQDEQLMLVVQDSGRGISEKELLHVFDRFYQIDSSSTRQGEGTGIGLAHTKELVKLLGGAISVESELEIGSCFIVSLPIHRNAEPSMIVKSAAKPRINHVPNIDAQNVEVFSESSGLLADLPQLLIIEDNPDVVVYLKTCLEGLYNLDVAFNGKIGIDKAMERIPDLIISDVMMPEKDGFEVCDLLKNDERTSHIPIILLTAKADMDSKMIGLKTGADAYLAKPFDKEELLIRLEKMIELRSKLQGRYAHMYSYQASKDKAVQLGNEETLPQINIEDAFLQKVNVIMDKELDNSDFNSIRLCRSLGLSQSQGYRKIKALTGETPAILIRKIRLERGFELLRTTDLGVSEIAYDVGFTDPAYFSRTFSDVYGSPPNENRG